MTNTLDFDEIYKKCNTMYGVHAIKNDAHMIEICLKSRSEYKSLTQQLFLNCSDMNVKRGMHKYVIGCFP